MPTITPEVIEVGSAMLALHYRDGQLHKIERSITAYTPPKDIEDCRWEIASRLPEKALLSQPMPVGIGRVMKTVWEVSYGA